MRWLTLILASLLTGCGDDDCCKGGIDAAAHDSLVVPPDALEGTCAGVGRDKIKFTRAESCGNDGSVEWCIPDNDSQLVATLTAIAPAITCAPGGGRAGCYTGGKLLCSYPTSYPEQCLSARGEMKPEVWSDICDVAAQPPITEIVATIFD